MRKLLNKLGIYTPIKNKELSQREKDQILRKEKKNKR